jgi:hypothetical protein
LAVIQRSAFRAEGAQFDAARPSKHTITRQNNSNFQKFTTMEKQKRRN